MNSLKFNEPQPSAFAQMVDKLRTKSEVELKMLYLRFFQKDLQTEWKNITQEGNFKKVSEDDIIKAIQKTAIAISMYFIILMLAT